MRLTLVATVEPSVVGCTPGGGTLGGNRIHFFEPLMTAFHALPKIANFSGKFSTNFLNFQPIVLDLVALGST